MVLCLNVLVLWAYSGTVRAKSKTTPNKEDASTVAKGAALLESDPPEVARVLRAHRNAVDNIVPFALLALLLVLWGASPLLTGILCGIFVFGRLVHSFAYLGQKQPWRTLSFVVSSGAMLVTVGFLVRYFIAAAS